MIALLSCSTSWCQNDTISSMGGLEQTDSLILVPISAIKIANSKMIELEYEKEINDNLRKIILNDSSIIATLNNSVKELEKDIIATTNKANRYKKQRNILITGGSGICVVLAVLLSLF